MERRPILDRVEDKIDFFGEGGCWIWTGWRQPESHKYRYGLLKMADGKHKLAHRLLYELVVEEIPSKKLVCDHLCRNPSCVNPDHIEVVTNQVNISRSDWSGLREIRKRKAAERKTCGKGHAWTEENTRIGRKQGRYCRACDTIKSKKRWAAIKAARENA